MSKHDDLVARAKDLNIAGVSPRWSEETLEAKIKEAEGAGVRASEAGAAAQARAPDKPKADEPAAEPSAKTSSKAADKRDADAPLAQPYSVYGAQIPGSTTPVVPDNGRGFSNAEAAIGVKSDEDVKREEEDRKRDQDRTDLAGFQNLRDLDKSGAWASVMASNPEAGVINEVSKLAVPDDDKSKGKGGAKAEAKSAS